MNYLQLCQTLRQECGASGDGPASVTSQTGESLRFVNWIRRAYLKIQTAHQGHRRWLHVTGTHALTADIAGYARSTIVASRFGEWDRRDWVVYPTADGVTSATDLVEISYADYERMYVFKSVASAKPIHFAIGPDEKVYLGPAPTAGITLRYRYWKGPQSLATNSEEPELPEANHWIIVYEAMKYYARREAAVEIMDSAVENFGLELDRLERQQLEQASWMEETLA
jgi:hypothetical protein